MTATTPDQYRVLADRLRREVREYIDAKAFGSTGVPAALLTALEASQAIDEQALYAAPLSSCACWRKADAL